MSGSEQTLSTDWRYQAIYQAIQAIVPGRVASYGAIARRAGLPGRARLVGYALRHSPADRVLPWHRVVRADGQLGINPESPSYMEQIERLRMEGVLVEHGRVAMSAFALDPDLDQALWGMPGNMVEDTDDL